MIHNNQAQHGRNPRVNKIAQRKVIATFKILHDKANKTEVKLNTTFNTPVITRGSFSSS